MIEQLPVIKIDFMGKYWGVHSVDPLLTHPPRGRAFEYFPGARAEARSRLSWYLGGKIRAHIALTPAALKEYRRLYSPRLSNQRNGENELLPEICERLARQCEAAQAVYKARGDNEGVNIYAAQVEELLEYAADFRELEYSVEVYNG